MWGVRGEGGLTSEVGVEDPRARGDLAGADHPRQSGHRLTLVDRVGEHALGAGDELDGIDGLLVGDAVGRPGIAVDDGDLLRSERTTDTDPLGRIVGDARDLGDGLLQRLGGIDPDDSAVVATFESKSGDHPGMRRSGDCAHDDVIEEDVVLGLLGGDLASPVGEAEPTKRMVGRARRDRIRRATGGHDGLESSLPAVADTDVEPGVVHPDVAAHDARQLDVPDPLIARIGPLNPVLLHRHRLQAEVTGDTRDLASVVRLDTADRHQRVTPLGEGVRHEVLQLADLVATERDTRVAVLTLGPDLDVAAQDGAEPTQRVNRRRAEQQRNTCEVVETHHRIVETPSPADDRPPHTTRPCGDQTARHPSSRTRDRRQRRKCRSGHDQPAVAQTFGRGGSVASVSRREWRENGAHLQLRHHRGSVHSRAVS